MFEKFEKLKNSKLSIFKIEDLSILLKVTESSARVIANRMIKEGILMRFKRDLYGLREKEPSYFLLANLLVEPSYISFESALNYWGITSQISNAITSAARRSKKMIVMDKEFSYSVIPREFYYLGIEREEGFSIANPVKAMLDMCYFKGLGKRSISFDDLYYDKLDKKRLLSYSKYYPKKTKEILRGIL